MTIDEQSKEVQSSSLDCMNYDEIKCKKIWDTMVESGAVNPNNKIMKKKQNNLKQQIKCTKKSSTQHYVQMTLWYLIQEMGTIHQQYEQKIIDYEDQLEKANDDFENICEENESLNEQILELSDKSKKNEHKKDQEIKRLGAKVKDAEYKVECNTKYYADQKEERDRLKLSVKFLQNKIHKLTGANVIGPHLNLMKEDSTDDEIEGDDI
jgi:hypothetical protein